MLDKIFHLKENGTEAATELIAGLTTFFAMAYIIAVNPSILSQAGMPWGAVFLATIIAAVIGTLVMGLFANVPYAQAPGMGLNAFFVFTVCFGLKFTWQQALSMVFLCGLINILITVTRVRKHTSRHSAGHPARHLRRHRGVHRLYRASERGHHQLWRRRSLADHAQSAGAVVFLIGLALIVILSVLRVKGAILISIIVTTLIGIPMG